MRPRVHFLTFATRDLDAARAFYRDGLGWEPLLDVPGEILFFQVAPGQVLGLFDADKFDEDRAAGTPTPGISGVILSHNVGSRDQVSEIIEQLVTAGGTVTKPPQPSPFGGVFAGHVADPNGIVWEIAHNPMWAIDAAGRVTLN
jgi:catechol 2,3-dioxygenase-like lactoylglutathione lyase family enzyme